MNTESKFEYKLNFPNRNISDKDLLDDLKAVSKRLNKDTLSFEEYDKLGKYSSSTIQTRFGTWNKAILQAGLRIKKEHNISIEKIFDNLRFLWEYYGRQPLSTECRKPTSKFSQKVYITRFGTWRKALEAFVDFINQNEPEENNETTNEIIEEIITVPENRIIHKTKREISERMRFRILLRDGFRCQSCGRSPIISPGVELHVDHKIPWSKGGESIDENLQCKCKECNLGKGNAFNE